MRSVFLYRHSKKVGHGDVHLSDEGIKLARQLGEDQLRGHRFTHFFVSSRQRTLDTFAALRDGAGDFPDRQPEVFPLHSQVFSTEDAMQLWEGVCNAAEQKGEDMLLAALQKDTVRAQRLSKQAGEAFRTWINALPEAAQVLVIDHSPAIELIVLNLFGITLTQLQPCDGVKIVENDGTFTFQSMQ